MNKEKEKNLQCLIRLFLIARRVLIQEHSRPMQKQTIGLVFEDLLTGNEECSMERKPNRFSLQCMVGKERVKALLEMVTPCSQGIKELLGKV